MKQKPRVMDLMRFITTLSPRYTRPSFLEPLVDVFRRIASGEEVRVCISCPPRHRKTKTLEHGVTWLLKTDPSLRIGWATYGDVLAAKTGRETLALAKMARVPLDKRSQSSTEWSTGVEEGGGFFTSRDGAQIGMGFDVQIVDDIVRNRVDAESPQVRQRTHEWFTDTWEGRGEPHASHIVCGHRWHPDDLIGRLIGEGWRNIVLPAIRDDGAALDPERFDLDALEKKRAATGEYGWWSLWMQQPRGRGESVFQDVHFYDVLPEQLRFVIGVDFNYSSRKTADYSVAVVIGVAGDFFYVVDVRRMQVTPAVFGSVLASLRDQYGGAPIVSYIGGQEAGILDLFRAQGLYIDGKPAREDKFVRAQPAADAWNKRLILLPREARWLNAYVDEVVSFTGVRDRHDDQVDATAAAFDAAVMYAGSRRRPGDGPSAFTVRSVTTDAWGNHVVGSRWGGGRGFG